MYKIPGIIMEGGKQKQSRHKFTSEEIIEAATILHKQRNHPALLQAVSYRLPFVYNDSPPLIENESTEIENIDIESQQSTMYHITKSHDNVTPKQQKHSKHNESETWHQLFSNMFSDKTENTSNEKFGNNKYYTITSNKQYYADTVPFNTTARQIRRAQTYHYENMDTMQFR